MLQSVGVNFNMELIICDIVQISVVKLQTHSI